MHLQTSFASLHFLVRHSNDARLSISDQVGRKRGPGTPVSPDDIDVEVRKQSMDDIGDRLVVLHVEHTQRMTAGGK